MNDKITYTSALKNSFYYVQSAPWALTGLFLLGMLPAAAAFILLMLGLGLDYTSTSEFTLNRGEFNGTVLLSAFVLLLVTIYVTFRSMAGVIALVLRMSEGDVESKFSLGWELGGKHFKSFLSVSLLAGLFVLLGSILFIVPGIILSLMFFLAPVIIINEKIGAMDALKRSRELMSGYKAWLFGLFIIYMIVSIFTSFMPVLGQVIDFILGLISLVLPVYMYLKLKDKPEEVASINKSADASNPTA